METDVLQLRSRNCGTAFQLYSVRQKKSPLRFSEIFSKRLGIFSLFLHTYYTIISTLDYKFLLKYLQLWQSYAILRATT